MGQASERHDLNSYETHSGTWIAFRQPVLRVAKERAGQPVQFTYEANPGRVWEEDEFWIELSWQIDAERAASAFASTLKARTGPARKSPSTSTTASFSSACRACPRPPRRKGLDPLAYMRKFGAFEVVKSTYRRHDRPLGSDDLAGAEVDPSQQGRPQERQDARHRDRRQPAWRVFRRRRASRSSTRKRWSIGTGPNIALPGYINSHVDWQDLDTAAGEFCLLPTFRLPTLIHTRSGAAKWLNEIAQCNPLWVHPSDGKRLGLADGDLVRVRTEIGYFVDRVWLTEAIRPGVVACSHHLGRWRRRQDVAGNRYSANVVDVDAARAGKMAGPANRRARTVRQRRSRFPARSGGARGACRRT